MYSFGVMPVRSFKVEGYCGSMHRVAEKLGDAVRAMFLPLGLRQRAWWRSDISAPPHSVTTKLYCHSN